ncbi:methionine--tRNA ligase [Brumimicrobium aurantiacum]|uniref:Methionine--tRNA ligase n=1 Tax=Brumimicrobium aurantiacum TaxID=1737063 RepID=A0A3E1F1T3_9FLAO|nr:methionine--tRNA ligase [Brumimicrobium aurantiacum]RFC55699.1 methionine--tRNA ligase [Brumimicrobium aurantiacum]
MNNKQKYTVTAALPYANGPIHLGHVAGVYLPADIFVRFLKHKQHDVAFISGSDEHGAAITLRAKKEGITPQAIVDKYNKIISDSFEKFDIQFDIFDRTTTATHKETAQDFFKVLNDKGAFTQKTTEQYFDEEHQQFLADRYISGECPKCGNPGAYGDQCEKCGSALSPTDLVNPVSTLSGKTPVLKETSHWFLPMERHEDWLREWVKEGKLEGIVQHDPKKWRNQVLGQCLSWIDGGLHPRAMTRDLDWGIPVPVEGADGKVLYVWLDAPIGYISATKDWAKANNKDWKDYWTGDRKLVHFIGKDNIVFHAIIFPILLKEHGEFILPDNVPASEFLNLEGDKFSTSRNWAVWLHEYLERHPEKVDELKYTLTSIAPESKDSEFTWVDFQSRVNNELADVLGNFVNRALVLTNKYYDGVVPALGELTAEDQKVIDAMKEVPSKVEELLYNYKIREAQSEVMALARIGNRYLAETEPWKVIKTDPKRVETILNLSLQIVANLSILFDPFIPGTSAKLRGFLNMEAFKWEQTGSIELLPAGTKTNKPSILFPKIDDEFIEKEKEILAASQKENESIEEVEAEDEKVVAPQKEDIQFDEFLKMDIRVGKILSAKKVKKADKLLELLVDTGLDQRTIVSGIAKQFDAEEIIGKKVSVLMNLPPRKLRGVTSNGMILMAEDDKGNLNFIAPGEDMEVGAEIR